MRWGINMGWAGIAHNSASLVPRLPLRSTFRCCTGVGVVGGGGGGGEEPGNEAKTVDQQLVQNYHHHVQTQKLCPRSARLSVLSCVPGMRRTQVSHCPSCPDPLSGGREGEDWPWDSQCLIHRTSPTVCCVLLSNGS